MFGIDYGTELSSSPILAVLTPVTRGRWFFYLPEMLRDVWRRGGGNARQRRRRRRAWERFMAGRGPAPWRGATVPGWVGRERIRPTGSSTRTKVET
jgi:hypothetical protein